MCGIAGIFDPRRSVDSLRRTTTAMTAALLHRGPDAGDTWVDGDAGIALGHRRLSILDLSPLGAQPMPSASGRYVLSYNGEVYNFAELRDELAGLGARFRGTSDTEVILAAIEAWGIAAAIPRLAGMFAIAVWDRERRELTLVRDRLGIKPLYWGRFGSLFLFGSELKALLACDGWEPVIDRDVVAAYARWNYVPSPFCIYRGLAKLAPGDILTIRAGAAPEIKPFWNLLTATAGQSAPPASDDEAAEQLEALLRTVVRQHMVSDVPLGAFLSGGIDSSLVVALMQAESARPVRSFTIGFHEPGYNEAVHAAAVARHIGTDHTELYVDPARAFQVIPNLPQHYDEPFADSSQIPTFLVSEMTRQRVTVALSGDGGDESFAGYTRYHWAELVRRRFLAWPAPLRGAAAGLLEGIPAGLWSVAGTFLPAGMRGPRLAERAVKLSRFLRQPDADSIYRRQHTQWNHPEDAVRGAQEVRGAAYDASLAASVPDFIQRMQLMDILTYLPDDILTKVDRASMAVSLEVRVPLLDHRVVEFAWRLPARMKVRGGVSKWLLRKVLHRHVSAALVERPKMGFSVPVARWLRGPLRDWAESLLDERRLREAGYFDATTVRASWNALLAGHDVEQEALWGALMFEAWREHYSVHHGYPVRARSPKPR